MERLSDNAIQIINDLHTERLDYNTEYLPLIDAANQLAAYEDTNHTPEECAAAFEELAAYRTAEQDGTLLRLPCKVGDIIYGIRGDWETGEPTLIPHRVKAIYPTIRKNGKFGFDIFATGFGLSITENTNMYYSREAAVSALKEREVQK